MNMKKIFYVLALAAAVILASCQKTPIGGTQTKALAGEWYVQVDIVDENGQVVEDGEDFNEGRSLLITYNLSSDAKDAFFVDDLENFWGFKVKVPCSLENKSFGLDPEKPFENYYTDDSQVYLWGGKIVEGGATTPSGQPADYIEFFVNFSDDDLEDYGMPGVSYIEYYGGYCYKVHGWRYTGFEADE